MIQILSSYLFKKIQMKQMENNNISEKVQMKGYNIDEELHTQQKNQFNRFQYFHNR